ncbi:uncharacterized protein SPSK_09628 [Sporothrix schenckii 1099-18]|uniref:Uncharacterized protein n=1 Tax=Sporothrix schenckii 1099-18 TaxID=1397361 RepID=A0A0F2M640_SPOSC|nr:uncharacterized protein SPSK_09628 [Sporothrix schenckii 1099-18]KJR84554.1 hypothetical protein SPSK_09628 [Sporothrix schenckii 1099-18]
MCQGVVYVYSCRHRDVGQFHLCHKARHPTNYSGCWPSMVYLFTGGVPKRQCENTKTVRQYHGEPCWTCRTNLSRPPAAVAPPRPSHFSPRSYEPEPMMRMEKPKTATTDTSSATSSSIRRQQPRAPTLPPPVVISRSSPLLPPSPPRTSRPTNASGRVRISPAAARSGMVMTSPAPFSRPPRISPSSSSSRSRKSGGDALLPFPNSRSKMSHRRLDQQAATLLEPPALTSPRPVSLTRPHVRRPPTSTGPYKTIPSSSSSLPAGRSSPLARKQHKANIATRMAAALRTPKSTESFACVDSRRIERDWV